MGGLPRSRADGIATPSKRPRRTTTTTGNLGKRWIAVLRVRAYPAFLLLTSLFLLAKTLSTWPPPSSDFSSSYTIQSGQITTVGNSFKPWRHLTKPLSLLRPKKPPPPPPPPAHEDRLMHSSYAGRDQDDIDSPPQPFVPLTRLELVQMVGRDPKFMVRDSHATYGYNNVRYILETTLLWAKTLGRIPVIPDSVWVRSCASDSELCKEHALEYYPSRLVASPSLGIVNNTWNEDGEIWRLGIETFLDLNHLRATYGPLLTMSEFFLLNDLDPSKISSSGHFDPACLTMHALSGVDVRHPSPDVKPAAGLSFARFPKPEFEPGFFVRVDESLGDNYLQDDGDLVPELEVIKLFMKEQKKRVFDVDEAKFNFGRLDRGELPNNEDGVVKGMKQIGMIPLWTFSDRVIMNKALALPTVEFVLPSRVLSLKSISSSFSKYSTSKVLWFQGEFHDQRKPGDIRFSTRQARDNFASMVIESVGPPEGIVRLGKRLARRMVKRTGGRRWMATHMRRGDFIGIDWSPYSDPKVHFDKTKEQLRLGTQKLRRNYPAAELPFFDDPFYLATDETSSHILSTYQSAGAVLLSDLLLPSDLELLGWSSHYGDVLALVEQQIMSHADYFVGSEMSSTTGGTINIRARWKKPNWSWGLLGRDVKADYEKQLAREEKERLEGAMKLLKDMVKALPEDKDVLVKPMIGPLEEADSVKMDAKVVAVETEKHEREPEFQPELEEEPDVYDEARTKEGDGKAKDGVVNMEGSDAKIWERVAS